MDSPAATRRKRVEDEDAIQVEGDDPEDGDAPIKTSKTEDKAASEDPSPETPEHYFENMYLKRIVKENHNAGIRMMSFNRTRECNSNLLATVGADQANIYDNANCGEHLDLMLNFVNVPLKDATRKDSRSQDLHALAWVDPGDSAADTYLAVGGADTFIHVISIARSRVVLLLKGHTAAITELASSAAASQLLLSSSRDKTVRLWSVATGACLAFADVHATALSFGPTPACFYTGGPGGTMKKWDASTAVGAPPGRSALVNATPLTKHHHADIDCIRTLGSKLVTKAVDGNVAVWDPESGGAPEKTLRVKGVDSSSPSHFDISADGRYLCAGNGQGVVFIWNLETCVQLVRLEYRRKESRAPVRACAFSHDLKNVVFVTSEPYLWRWDYVDPKAVAAYREKQEQD